MSILLFAVSIGQLNQIILRSFIRRLHQLIEETIFILKQVIGGVKFLKKQLTITSRPHRKAIKERTSTLPSDKTSIRSESITV